MKTIPETLALASLTSLLAIPLHGALLHRYKFDETSGTVAADFVGTANGTIGANVVLGQAAKLGSSFKFPTVAANAASRVTLPSSVVPGAEFTMSAFYNLTAALGNGGQMHIISGNSGGANRWNFMLYDNDATAGVSPCLTWFHDGAVGLGLKVHSTPISNIPGQWVHVGITRDATGLTKLFINGVGVSIGTSTGALKITDIGIGEVPNASVSQFNGRIDDVRFYNNALTDSEMAALAAEDDDTDADGLPDVWETFYFGDLTKDGANDFDADGFNNRIEYLAGTNPADNASFPTGNTDGDLMDDAWEWLNFGTLARDGYGDFDKDGLSDEEEFLSTSSILIVRNPNGSIASATPFFTSSDPKNVDSQTDSDADGLPDGYEYLNFGGLVEDKLGDFDLDTFTNGAEFTANSLVTRKNSTPLNVHLTTRIAVAHNAGIAEYSVTDRVWTLVKQITAVTGGVFSVTGSPDGYLYATTQETTPRVLRINPANGTITTLATRNQGDAITAGWITSSAQGIQEGPDGKLYFSTAFSTAGEGVFRLNKDGTGFENFITRTGGVAPDNWDLNNARDLQWKGSTLYVSARGGFGATNRPVYQFNAAGAFVATLTSTLIAPQGLALDENGLLVASTTGGTPAISLLNLTDTPPVGVSSRANAATLAPIDLIDLNGDTYSITYNTGAGAAAGQIFRNDVAGTATLIVPALVSLGNGLAIYTSNLVADPYDDWALAQGINPSGPKGGPNDDFDGDGTSNRVEFALGLDPKSGTSRFAIATSGTPAVGQTLTWPSQPGISFEVRSSVDLYDWSTVEATVIGQPAVSSASWTAPAAVGLRKFYRVQFTP